MNERSAFDVIRLSGELDISRKQELRDALALAASARAVLVDLAGVTYADSTALAELLRFSARAEREGVPVAVLITSPQFDRLIRYAGGAQAFRIFRDRAEALTYLKEVS